MTAAAGGTCPAEVRQHGVMAHDRTFRFAAQLSKAPDGSARSWAAQARKFLLHVRAGTDGQGLPPGPGGQVTLVEGGVNIAQMIVD